MNQSLYRPNGTLVFQASNGTQPGDPPAGVTVFNPDGSVFSTRPLSPGEITSLAQGDTNTQAGIMRANIIAQAQQARIDNTAFLAIPVPTTNQAITQVHALTMQNNRIMRLLLAVAGVDGTLDGVG